MPDDRLFHKKLGHSVKVNALTDIEEIVWRTYVMAADDFGVMRYLPLPLQDFYDRLAKRPTRVIQRALDRLTSVGLIRTFAHQGHTYCYQHDWQDFQKVEYPRTTILPKPPVAALEDCSKLTRSLFTYHPGGVRAKARANSGSDSGSDSGIRSGSDSPNDSGSDSGSDSGTSRARSHAPARTLTANAKTNGSRFTLGGAGGGVAELVLDPQPAIAGPEFGDRAARFCERYAELYAAHRRGARYYAKPSLDYVEALGLVTTWDDARLEQLVVAFLTTDEPFCRNGSGTIAQFRSRASWCDAKLREAGL